MVGVLKRLPIDMLNVNEGQRKGGRAEKDEGTLLVIKAYTLEKSISLNTNYLPM